ncbi:MULTISPECIES: PaaI family thioesterase [unclassified Clostridium]|uniref:PaaI family thioesterase n=1 Tax=unclassified Clostridium TaxID=2614128 RepID=UPI003F905D78
MNILEALNIGDIILKENYAEAKMKITEFHDQSYGVVHGGLTITLAETLAGYASNNIIDESLLAVGQTITANHVKPKEINGYLKACAKLIHKGKNTHLWSVNVIDESGVVISLINIRNAIVQKYAKQQM